MQTHCRWACRKPETSFAKKGASIKFIELATEVQTEARCAFGGVVVEVIVNGVAAHMGEIRKRSPVAEVGAQGAGQRIAVDPLFVVVIAVRKAGPRNARTDIAAENRFCLCGQTGEASRRHAQDQARFLHLYPRFLFLRS